MTAGGALAIAARLAQRGCARATTVAKWVRWCDLGAGIVPEAVDASGASETGAVSCQDDCLGCCALRSGTVCLARPACDPRGSRVACLFRATNPFGGLEGNRRANASPEVGLALCPCSYPAVLPPILSGARRCGGSLCCAFRWLVCGPGIDTDLIARTWAPRIFFFFFFFFFFFLPSRRSACSLTISPFDLLRWRENADPSLNRIES